MSGTSDAAPGLLGLDFGTKRIGVAVGHPETGLAFPVETYHRKSRNADAEYFRRIAVDHRVGRLIVGLPSLASGTEGDSARRAREWGRGLARELGLPVVFIDERYTSAEADRLLRDRGLKASERKGRVDMLAAQIMLQAYIDAGCPEVDCPGEALEDLLQ
jgi:putative Holliday junction resolvase